MPTSTEIAPTVCTRSSKIEALEQLINDKTEAIKTKTGRSSLSTTTKLLHSVFNNSFSSSSSRGLFQSNISMDETPSEASFSLPEDHVLEGVSNAFTTKSHSSLSSFLDAGIDDQGPLLEVEGAEKGRRKSQRKRRESLALSPSGRRSSRTTRPSMEGRRRGSPSNLFERPNMKGERNKSLFNLYSTRGESPTSTSTDANSKALSPLRIPKRKPTKSQRAIRTVSESSSRQGGLLSSEAVSNRGSRRDLLRKQGSERMRVLRTDSSRDLEGGSVSSRNLLGGSPSSKNKQQRWNCTGCGDKNIAHHKFCGSCGTTKKTKSTKWECVSCGTDDNEGRHTFCGGCGAARCAQESNTTGSSSPVSVRSLSQQAA